MTSDSVLTPPALPPFLDALGPKGIARLIAGLAQGIILYGLFRSVDGHVWPATDPYWRAALTLVFIFVPVLFIQAFGSMRVLSLGLWLAGATLLLALLAWHDIWRQSDGAPISAASLSFALIVFTIAGLIIGQALVTAGDAERQYIARYPAYFDVAWKLAVQLTLTFAFLAVFWAVLWLGAILFTLINLSFIETLIERSWFAIPATTLAIAAALHLTDVRASLVAGIRAIVLTLLSWLLPLLALIAIAFTLSLPFTGLAPLLATHSASAILLAAAAALVVLINAAYQNGEPSHHAAIVLRYAEFAASLILVPIVILAGYALALRVDQYGLTVERIATAACVLVALGYALGYATAAIVSLRQGSWMQRLETVNVATAFGILVLLLILFSQLGDPARLSVESQVARLVSGTVTPEAFDYAYLKSEGGRYGHLALRQLVAGEFGPHTGVIRKLARAALAGYGNVASGQAHVDIPSNVTVYPPSRQLPRGFVLQDWSRIANAPACLTTAAAKCDAFYADLDGDGNDELVLTSGNDTYFSGTILQLGSNQLWKPVGTVNGHCAGMLAALKRGEALIAPSASLWRDWVILGVHLHPARSGEPPQPCPRQF